MTRYLIAVLTLVAGLVAGCGGDDTESDPTTSSTSAAASTGGMVPACETNVTGRITIQNTGTQLLTAVLNGINQGNVNTGSSLDVDLPPGPYLLEIKYANGGGDACTPATVNISKCSTQTVSCAG